MIYQPTYTKREHSNILSFLFVNNSEEIITGSKLKSTQSNLNQFNYNLQVTSACDIFESKHKTSFNITNLFKSVQISTQLSKLNTM